MVHMIFELSLAICVIWEIGSSFGDNSISQKDYYEKFQKIPPALETAKKLYRNFLGGETRRLHKRQILGNYFDVILVLDSSSSVSRGEFAKGLSALEDLVKKSRNDTSYAAVTYSTSAKIQFNFTSSAEIETAGRLRAIKRSGGKTNTQAALKRCQQMYVGDQYGARQGSFRRILVVSDGQSNINRDETVPSAFQLKLLGIEVFVIAVGEYLEGIQELVQMASSSDAHMYRVMNMRGLVQIIKLIPAVGQRSLIDEFFGGKSSEEDDGDASPLERL